ncbi:TPA: alpha/beta hydrolase [Stenotrophomonas maltophilia]
MRRIAGLCLIVCGLSSCTSVPDVAYWPEHEAVRLDAPARSERMVIEIDDAGRFHWPGQFDRLQHWLAEEPAELPVVVFINGWHHNASPNDSNFTDFDQFLAKVEARAGTPVRGLYVGWRGDSIDTPLTWEPSDFLTVWDRKCASVTVGEGGLAQVVTMLREQHPERAVYMIGHSFGGSALFHAIKDGLAQEQLHGFEYFMLNPAVAEGEFDAVEQALVAAWAASPAFSGAVSITAADALRQHRKVTVLQAQGDKAVGWGYRIAFRDTPIGFDRQRQTHRAKVCNTGDACRPSPADTCTATLADGRFVLRAVSIPGQGCVPMQQRPVWVIAGEDSVSANHNDILNSIQAEALADLLAQRWRQRAGR